MLHKMISFVMLCDKCGCSNDYSSGFTTKEARADFAIDGWVRKRYNNRMADICPSCDTEQE